MIRDFFVRVLVFLLTFSSVVCPAEAAQRCFSEEALGSVTGICITELEGSVSLEGRTLRPGDVLTAEQALRMTASEDALAVGYLPIFADGVAEAEMTLSLRGKENKEPVAEDSAMETYKNLPNTAKWKVTDPEGETLTFAVVRQPRRGTVEIGDDGSFIYTPKKNKVGIDSFTWTATDPAGNVSREATVTVTILKPSDAARYTDTLGRDCRFAAEWMRHTGIFTAEKLGQEACFGPEKTVTRGEFVTMLVKALDIPPEEEAAYTGYEEVPDWLKPYLAAAVRSGLTAGLPAEETFGTDLVITGTEAAVMLENALDTAAFEDLTEAPMTRAQAAQTLYEAAKLLQQRKADTVI